MNAHVRPAVPFTIAADLNLDEALEPWSRGHGADVTVARGAVPESLPHPEAEGIAWQYADGRLLLRTPCGVRFLVEGACTVRYALDGGASLRDCRLFLLRAALPALAVQRGLLPLCASAVVHGEGVCAFVGKRGGRGQVHPGSDARRARLSILHRQRAAGGPSLPGRRSAVLRLRRSEAVAGFAGVRHRPGEGPCTLFARLRQAVRGAWAARGPSPIQPFRGCARTKDAKATRGLCTAGSSAPAPRATGSTT